MGSRPRNPKQALERLKYGNERFRRGVRSDDLLFSHEKLAKLPKGQMPFAIVLTCSDSRSPVEMIFDQGLGDLFVVRVAGNVVAPSLLGSIEFAASQLGAILILVMGHTRCGAVTVAYEHSLRPSQPLPSPHLEELVSRIRPAVEKVKSKKSIKKSEKRIEIAIQENVKRSMGLIYEQSQIIRELVNRKKIKIEGAILDVQTGKVRFL